MAKIVAFEVRKELAEQHSSAELVGLIRVTPVGGGAPILLSTHPVTRFSVDPLRYGIVSRGERYDFMAVRFQLPDSSRDELPQTSMEMDNIDPAVVAAVRSSIDRARLDLETVMSTRPNDVMERFPNMEVRDATWTDDVVSIEIAYESLATTPLAKHRMTVGVFPALRTVG